MSIDFFEQQDHARRQSGRLILLFLLAVLAIITAVYAVVTVVALSGSRSSKPGETSLSRGVASGSGAILDVPRLAIVITGVLAVISAGSLYKIATLRDGGDAVARMLGGRLLNPARVELRDRRLLNVVEEMALASGTPVPPVYVLDDEPSINAFAAGFTPGDAVIGVSRGAIDHLSRDELQGVIGHEFSHILNGDMRLNLRLIGLVHGILVIALIGQLIVRIILEGSSRGSRSSRSDDKGGGAALVMALLIFGGSLYAIGWLGVFLGRVIKAAISRQREFLADASSVQFTRNPDGIVGALKKIGGLAAGSRLENRNAEQAAHMFFGQGIWTLTGLLATHPPLVARIRRIEPTFDGAFAPVDDQHREPVDPEEAQGVTSNLAARRRSARHVDVDPRLRTEEAMATIGRPTEAHVDYAASLLAELPPAVAEAAREPFSARAVVFALLLDPNEAIRNRQLAHLDQQSEPGTVHEVVRLAPLVAALGKPARIPLADLTFPALRRLSLRQYHAFRSMVETLVRADERVVLFEYTLQRMLIRQLDRAFLGSGPPTVRHHSLDAVFGDADLLLSALARLGHRAGTETEAAYNAAMRQLQANYPGERQVRLLPRDRCSLGAVDRALDRLAGATPEVKRRVIDACAASIACDGVLTLPEAELLRAVADSLDCPMPPLLSRPEELDSGSD
ncbi:MAG: M48 family metalloprotease [Isosphaeraceae bacterium]